MDKQQLVARAQQAYLPDSVVKALAFAHSDEAAEKRCVELARKARKYDTLSSAIITLVLIINFFGFFCIDPSATTATADAFSLPSFDQGVGAFFMNVVLRAVLAGLMSIVALIVVSVLSMIGRDLFTDDTQVKWLFPVAGTADCARALVYLEQGGEYPALWRDLVLAERSQLIGLDIEVLRTLAEKHKWERTEEQKRQEHEAACKKLHGFDITPVQSA